MLHYKKNNNDKLFNSFKNEKFTSFSKVQNYIPIYKKFFKLNNKNFNIINLNHKYHISEIFEKKTNNIFKCNVKNDNSKQKLNLFFKFSPLLNPVKYLTGKYKNQDICDLPQYDNKCHNKLLDSNNAAYTDSFFYYLSSCLFNKHKFINSTNFYGSFIGIKNNFIYNIYDDLEYLYNSTYFNENTNDLFKINNLDEDFFMQNSSLKNKKKINISNSNFNLKVDNFDNSIFENIFTDNDSSSNLNDLTNSVIFSDIKKKNKTNNTSSTCSSRCSSTSNEDDEEFELSEEEFINSEEEGEEELSDNSSIYSSESEESNEDENIDCVISKFPVQVICIENLENTLDSMLEDEDYDISEDEWKSILMQVIMTLLVYQKCFHFTHNDLHTNNIMYIKTDKKFIYYKYDEKTYKVPTYGKIFKLIDFGRSIYKYKGVQMCSDSFHPKGDAATQFNFGIYYNEKKPKIEPNYSFDLCRLACSLYDFFIEEEDDENNILEERGEVAHLIHSWIIDDKGKNILYKKNGEERYPDFKLYKMITRLVHNHTPKNQLENPIFQKFLTSKRKLNKSAKSKIIDIDAFEVMI
jgi:hypothetical protein